MSICMWVSEGSIGPSRNGGNKHVHDDVPIISTRSTAPTKPEPPAIPIAPIEVRDAVYRELLRISPARKYYPHLVAGPDGLLLRGLTEAETHNYGALPPSQAERAQLAHQLYQFAINRFPQYGDLHNHPGIVGIPGCWQDQSGKPQIWKPREFQMPMLVIPYQDQHGRIQACQLRLHKGDIPEGEKRYRWLSSPLEPKGCSSGTPIHFTFRPEELKTVDDVIPTIVITEGALKIQTFVSLRPLNYGLATSGVACSHEPLIAAARPYNAQIAFDADHKTNPAVCRQLARLIAGRETDARNHGLLTTTRIVHWEGYKGIDDAANAKQKVEFSTLSITEWRDTLSGKPKDEVVTLWNDLGFVPET